MTGLTNLHQHQRTGDKNGPCIKCERNDGCSIVALGNSCVGPGRVGFGRVGLGLLHVSQSGFINWSVKHVCCVYTAQMFMRQWIYCGWVAASNFGYGWTSNENMVLMYILLCIRNFTAAGKSVPPESRQAPATCCKHTDAFAKVVYATTLCACSFVGRPKQPQS